MIILSNNQWKCDCNLPKWEAKGEAHDLAPTEPEV